MRRTFKKWKRDQPIIIRFLIDVVDGTITTGVGLSLLDGKPANMLFACGFFMFCMTIGCFLFEMGEIIFTYSGRVYFGFRSGRKELFDELIFCFIKFTPMF